MLSLLRSGLPALSYPCHPRVPSPVCCLHTWRLTLLADPTPPLLPPPLRLRPSEKRGILLMEFCPGKDLDAAMNARSKATGARVFDW